MVPHFLVALTALIAVALAESIPLQLNVHVTKRGSNIAPVMGGQNFPDPSLIRVGNNFYAFATGGHLGGNPVHVQMANSTDFSTWALAGTRDALPHLPSWVDPNSPSVWAPDVVQIGNNAFVMYYSAATKTNPALHCLGAATSTTVQGPYTPTSQEPWICPLSQGGAIDPSGYYDTATNTRWVVYKIDGNTLGHGGSCNNGIPPLARTPIMLQQLSPVDGTKLLGAASGPLITNGPADGPVVEAPSLTRFPDGTYVLFFSSNCYATPLYDVSYATARQLRGPYTKFGPLLVTGVDGLVAPGGLDVAVDGDHAVFHADFGAGRAMYTALIAGAGDEFAAYVRTSP
ncbi:hypothetical protein MBLNU459_g1310t1 [Dothideomycetes sp. NU459]